MKTTFTNRFSRTAGIAALVLALAGSASAQDRSGTLHYFAVGISSYMGQHNLRYADKDAMDLSQEWRNQEGRLYRRVEGETLLNYDATRSNILAGLDRLCARVQRGDVVAISLAGHGGTNPNSYSDPDWYFMAYESQAGDMQGTAISSSLLRSKLAELNQRGATVVLILDSCRSGTFGSAPGNVVVLAGCLPHESSHEHWSVHNGLFTRALIEALQGKADANGDGDITLEEIQTYVAQRLAELLSMIKPNLVQHSTSSWSPLIRGELPLARPMSSRLLPSTR